MAKGRDSRLFEMQTMIIPYHVQQLRYGAMALELDKRHVLLAGMDVYVDGVKEPVHRSILSTFTQPVSCMAAMYARLLLAFLGLAAVGQTMSTLTVARRNGDIGIENFIREDGVPFELLAPTVANRFDSPNDVLRAWAETCNFANQRLAHLTDDRKLNGADVREPLLCAFETIPEVIQREFFDRLA